MRSMDVPDDHMMKRQHREISSQTPFSDMLFKRYFAPADRKKVKCYSEHT